MTTDGASAMVETQSGVIGLMKKDPDFGCFVSYHCIIHQESLCGKKMKLESVMTVVVKIVNFIRAQTLNHRQFHALLDEVDVQYADHIFHCDVRWLSRGKVLDRFLALLPEIKQFLTEK